MIILLNIIHFILEFLTQYLLMPFAALSVKIYELEEKIQNKFVYFLISIPLYLIIPFSLLWIVLSFWKLDIQEKIKYEKQRREANKWKNW